MARDADLTMAFLVKLTMMLLAVLSLVVFSVGQQLCDHCNCQISSKTDFQAIYSMTLICNTGTIMWFGASGAIRIELTPYVHGNFRACFLAETENTHIKIYQENPEMASAQNYRLQTEKSRTLKLDHLLTSSEESKEFCVVSKKKEPLLLYLEAVRIPGVESVPKVMFHYDIEKMDSHAVMDPMDECRPCTKEEILDAYCSMDFVAIGNMADVTNFEIKDRSDVTLAIKQVIHQREPHFFQRVKRSDPHLTGHVTVPKKCGMRKIDGDFLLTGRIRLKTLALGCAAHLHEWRRIQHEVECTHG